MIYDEFIIKFKNSRICITRQEAECLYGWLSEDLYKKNTPCKRMEYSLNIEERNLYKLNKVEKEI